MNEQFKNEDQEIVRMFDVISTTITFVSQSYSYFYNFSYGNLSEEERRLTYNEVFRFYKMTSQFFMVIQFCKLFESHSKNQEGDSSLIKLNNKLSAKYRSEYKKHSENVSLSKELVKSDIFQYVKQLRNKSYAHAENHPLNSPLKFVLLKEDQLIEFKNILLLSIKILNNCYSFYDTSTTFHHFYDSTTPANFIKNYSEAKKVWIENNRRR